MSISLEISALTDVDWLRGNTCRPLNRTPALLNTGIVSDPISKPDRDSEISSSTEDQKGKARISVLNSIVNGDSLATTVSSTTTQSPSGQVLVISFAVTKSLQVWSNLHVRTYLSAFSLDAITGTCTIATAQQRKPSPLHNTVIYLLRTIPIKGYGQHIF